MGLVAERVLLCEHTRQPHRERVNDGNLGPQPPVGDGADQPIALTEQFRCANREFGDAGAQARRRRLRSQRFDGGPVAGQDIQRQVDPVEIAIIRAAVLEVVDDLQRRADRIGSRPCRRALPVHVEDEASNRHRRKGAVRHQIIPIRVAPLDRIEPKSLQEVLGVPRRKPALTQRAPQSRRFGSSLQTRLAEQSCLHAI